MSDTQVSHRTVERRVAALSVAFHARVIDHAGREVDLIKTARRGELVTFPISEAARLDALGALAPPGHSVEQIEADIAATYEAYTGQRQQLVDNWTTF